MFSAKPNLRLELFALRKIEFETMGIVNLDNNATTPVDPRVADLVDGVQRTIPGNPSSLHGIGRASRRVVEDARERVARAMGCEPREVVFVASATEANNLAIRGVLGDASGAVLVNPMEHKSVLEPLEASPASIQALSVRASGSVDVAASTARIEPRASLLVCQAANNETGCIQPIEELSSACKGTGVALFCDAVQAPGRMEIGDLMTHASMVALSSHKIFGPKGAGALVVKAETGITPMILGGAQERGRRAGTENVAAIAGFGLALELAVEEAEERQAILVRLDERLQEITETRLSGSRLNSLDADRLSGVMNICVPGTSAESLMMNLDMAGFAVSVGSACSSGSTEPSHVLEAMGLSLADNHASIRFSLSHLNTFDELDALDTALKGIAPRLFL